MYGRVFFFIFIVILIILGFVFLIDHRYVKQAFNFVDLNLAQYSDRQITENAKIKDPKLNYLAFFSAPKLEDGSLSQMAGAVAVFKTLFLQRPKSDKGEYGTWLWTPTLSMTPIYMQSVISKAKVEGINTFYLSIDSYLDIYAMQDGKEKDDKLKAFKAKLDQFISIAGDNGIAVDAEAGWRNWAETGNTYKPFVIANFVNEFNLSSANKFRGFQYDVEPYLLNEYKTDQASVLRNFVQLINDTVYFFKDKNIKLSVVVPDFWDKRDKATVAFEYKNRSDFVFGHLLNILDQNVGSNIIVMSYRNFSEGKDGSIDISSNEMSSAKWGFHSTGIILASESGDVPPSYVTFYGTSKKYFTEQTANLRSAFVGNPNFAGLAVHYANAFFELK